MIHMFVKYMPYNRMILLNKSDCENFLCKAIFLLYHVQKLWIFFSQ
jgi:hypothetical protein